MFKSLVVTLYLESETGCEVLFVSDHDINIFCYFPVDFLGLRLSADGAPHGRTVVQVIGYDGAIFLSGLACCNDRLAGLFRKSGIDPACMQPTYAQCAENVVKVKIFRCHLGNGRIGAVRTSNGSADPETTLSKKAILNLFR